MKQASCCVIALITLFLFLAGGCGGGGGGGGAAGPSPYVINPATERIAVDTPAPHLEKSLAINNSGIHVAVWNVRRGDPNSTVLFSVYSGGIWSQENVVAEAYSWTTPVIASNGTDFMMAYLRGNHYYVRRFNPVSGIWEVETMLDSSTSYQYGQVSICSNGSGYAVTWAQEEGTSVNLYANIYAGGVWGGPMLIENGAGLVDKNYGPRIASNGSGYAVTWVQNDGIVNSIYASIFTSTWSAPVLVENASGSASSPQIAASGSGYAVTWAQNDGSQNSIYASIYSSGWGTATLLESSSGAASSPQIASSGTGTGYAVTWSQSSNLYVNIFNGSTWGGATTIELLAGSSTEPRIASHSGGYAVTWSQYDSGTRTYSIYANIYSGSSWVGEVLLENASGTASNPQIVGKAGSGYACVWSQFDGTVSVIYATRYSGTWATPTSLVTRSYSTDSLGPIVASDSNGGRMAVWEQYSDAGTRIFGSLFSNGTWSMSFEIGTGSGGQFYPWLATNGSGYAVVWNQSGSGNANLFVNVYANGAWSGPTLLEVGTGQVGGTGYRIASNGSGYAVAWYQNDGTASSIYANVYSNGAWSGATLLESANGVAYTPQIQSNGSGYAVTWNQNDGTAYSIYTSVYANNAWSAATLLENGTGAASSPQIASNGSGYAVAWYQNDGSVNSIYANVFNGTWGTATLLENGTGAASGPQIVSNGNGYAVAWYQNDGSVNSIYTSVYTNNAWSAETLLESGAGATSTPQIASNGSGYAVAWYQSDGSANSIYANVYNGIWGTATLLENGAGAVYGPKITRSGSGYCAVWPQKDPGNGVNAYAYQIWTTAF